MSNSIWIGDNMELYIVRTALLYKCIYQRTLLHEWKIMIEKMIKLSTTCTLYCQAYFKALTHFHFGTQYSMSV